MSLRIGVDLGGTKIEALALGADGRELLRRRVPTPQGDYEGTVRGIVSLVTGMERELGARGSVGVGIPGIISPRTGLVKNANSVCLIGHPLDKDLEAALGRPVRLENDANCMALSEASDGSGAGARCVFGVILGTGVGGGVVFNGAVLTGRNHIGGEWGHNPLPAPLPDEIPGPRCYCGRHGCIETFLSGPALEREYQASSGRPRSAPEIVQLAEQGDGTAEKMLRRYEDRLARALGTIINVLDPDVIVLAGGMSNVKRLYTNVPNIWGRYVFSDAVDTALRPPTHGDSSGVRGAAWLWPAA
ncbi:MAG: ROK family protein [Myxococcota bacterium]